MSVPTFVVADVHGGFETLLGLLESVGIVEEGLRSDLPCRVVQLGDLANCVMDSDEEDLDCLAHVGDWIDLMLVGNHEHPYFDGPIFWGFSYYGAIAAKIHELYRAGLIRTALEVDGILLTHAGLGAHRNRWDTAKEAERAIADRWKASPRHWIFSDISRHRGGSERTGGILWADWAEPKSQVFPQLVGHTVGEDIRRKGKATCIDLGGGKYTDRLAGAWIRDGEIEVVVYDQRLVAVARREPGAVESREDD